MGWYEQTFGACPHGYIKPYCGQCAIDEDDAAREERNRQQDDSDRTALKATIATQSVALVDAVRVHPEA